MSIRRLSPEKRVEIIAELTANPNATAVTEKVGVSYADVWRLARRAGIELTAGKAARGFRGLPREKRAEVIAELTAHPNACAVAEKVGGISATGVWKIALKEGIKLGGRGSRLPPEKYAEIVAALKDNPNAAQVARKVGGVSTVSVWHIAGTENIELANSPIAQARRRREANQHLAGRHVAHDPRDRRLVRACIGPSPTGNHWK